MGDIRDYIKDKDEGFTYVKGHIRRTGQQVRGKPHLPAGMILGLFLGALLFFIIIIISVESDTPQLTRCADFLRSNGLYLQSLNPFNNSESAMVWYENTSQTNQTLKCQIQNAKYPIVVYKGYSRVSNNLIGVCDSKINFVVCPTKR